MAPTAGALGPAEGRSRLAGWLQRFCSCGGDPTGCKYAVDNAAPGPDSVQPGGWAAKGGDAYSGSSADDGSSRVVVACTDDGTGEENYPGNFAATPDKLVIGGDVKGATPRPAVTVCSSGPADGGPPAAGGSSSCDSSCSCCTGDAAGDDPGNAAKAAPLETAGAPDVAPRRLEVPTADQSEPGLSSRSTSSPPATPSGRVKELPESVLLTEYTVERVIGRGANGKVSLCRSTHTGELYALKAVRGAAAGSTLKRNRLNRKLSDSKRPSLYPPPPAMGETMAVSLPPHENVLRVLEVIPHDPTNLELGAQVVMEPALGGALSPNHFRPGGSLDEARLALAVRGMARGLAYLHSMGVVHGDLKLGNLLLGGPCAETVKVADLGCASRFEPSTPAYTWWVTNRPAGTPAYLAPEQTTEEPYLGGPADIWALGVCLFRLATGRLPFEADSIIGLYAAIEGHETSPVDGIAAELTPQLEDLLRRMLAKAPLERITAADVLAHPWLQENPR